MARAREPLVEAALDLAWSHWDGLGVRGVVRAPDSAVDPEALIHFTAVLAKEDPRLWDEATDWWVRFQRFVSRSRVARLSREFDEGARDKVRELDASVAARPKTSGKSRLERLDTAARTLLRLRCAFGANARAEILLALLTLPAHQDATARSLSELGYSKRNIALVLDELRFAGLVTASPDANRTRYRLAAPEPFAELFAPVPEQAMRWHVRLPLIARFVALAERIRGKDPLIQAVEARKTLANQSARLAALDVGAPSISSPNTYWTELQTWLVDHLLREPSRRVPRMVEGVWFLEGATARKPLQFTSAVLPARGVEPAGDDRAWRGVALVQTSLVEPPGWRWSVSPSARMQVRGDSHARPDAPLHFATWDFGEQRSYRVDFGPALLAEKLVRQYGDVPVVRQALDQPVTQLVLTRES